MTIDPTITWGALLNAAILFTGFVVAFTRIGGRIDLLTQRVKGVEDILTLRMESVEEKIRAQRDVSERLAVIETRQAADGHLIAGTQADIRDLKHGRGFIKSRPEPGLDGEYP